MEDIRSIVSRLPELELQIRRRCIGDANFRGICADYEDAAKAYRYWQLEAAVGDAAKRGRAEEYERLLAELEVEIRAYLNASASKATA